MRSLDGPGYQINRIFSSPGSSFLLTVSIGILIVGIGILIRAIVL